MSWFRLDDKFHSHPKILTAGNAAIGLYVRAGCYCSDHATDGLVAFPVASLLGKPREAQALCDAGLWVKTDDGYQIPDYLEFNPSRAQVEAQRAGRSDAKAKAGKIGGVASGRSRTEAKEKQNRSTGEADGQANVKQNEAPSRPDPTPTNKSSSQLQVGDVDNPTATTLDQRVVDAIDLHARESAKGAKSPGAYAATVRNNTMIEHSGAMSEYVEQHPDATSAEIVAAVFSQNTGWREPVKEAWYADPHCQSCDGDGHRNHAPEGAAAVYGPCDCRRDSPYLAEVVQLRQAAI